MPLLGKRRERAEAEESASGRAPEGRGEAVLPRGEGRRGLKSLFTRIVAAGGIVGIGTAVAAILGTQDVAAWIIGLVVATLSVSGFVAILRASRTL